MHDLVVRGGTLIDGTGGPRRTADVAVRGGRVVEVGRVAGRGRHELDAAGLLVTPGFVDVHTHYDGQATWDPLLTPSSWHGVTTVLMGNCGVGFAPAAPERHEWLIGLMEGVEDIPGTALAEGIRWEWESFPEYLDALAAMPRAMDVAAQLPHGALRAYVMGERGADHQAAPTSDEIDTMARLLREALTAGALGFTSSRTRNHRTRDGAFTPSLTAGPDEMLGLARALGEARLGVFEMVADFADLEKEFALLRRMVEVSGRPMSISVAQNDLVPDQWRRLLARIGAAAAAGLPMKAQVPPRAIGLLFGLQATLHPFCGHPSYRPLAQLPAAEQARRLTDPELRRRILAEAPPRALAFLLDRFDRMFELGDPPDYEPPPERSVAAQAARLSRAPSEHALDLLLRDEGRALLYRPLLNYTDASLDVSREMLLDPHAVPGLGDAGAHCGMICDGSYPTFLVAHWGRDRTRGERLPLEWLVKRQTADTAALVGLGDRGVLAPGMRADLNLIEWEALRLHPPEIVFDLPAGGKRLIQRADGYRATVVAGEVTFENGEPTGALPGRLVRGARPAPTEAPGACPSSPPTATSPSRRTRTSTISTRSGASARRACATWRSSATPSSPTGWIAPCPWASWPRPASRPRRSAWWACASRSSTAAAGIRRPGWQTRRATASPPR
jgi:N-acyl-D-aspartate/D-glutamate deacylase